VLRTDCRFTLVESRNRKAAFLLEATRTLPNTEVICGRAEELNRRFDWAVCRAVSPDQLLPLYPRLADHIALLTTVEAAPTLAGAHRVPIPWRQRGVALTFVPRETSGSGTM